MRAPYKYPYLSIFILSYYFLEHEGYYYKLKKYFGSSENTSASYIIRFNDENFSSLAKAPGRKALVYFYDSPDESQILALQKIARSYKEKLRSPIIFADVQCGKGLGVCENVPRPCLAFFHEGDMIKRTNEQISKKVVKKILKASPSSGDK
jgi:hypothetical protein